MDESLTFDPSACGLHQFAADETVTWKWGDASADTVIPPGGTCSGFGCAVHSYAAAGRYFVGLVEDHSATELPEVTSVLVVVVEASGPCAWERGGLPEESPAPCATPVPVEVQPTPVHVVVEGTPAVTCVGCVGDPPSPTVQDVLVVNETPVPVADEAEPFWVEYRTAMVLGVGLLLFVGLLALLRSWGRRLD
ncbi:MAG: hypothetical protein LC722_04825 [Actinobacteria bacterium]|nr:hypothetical protein [Actinomycetota bacterium]